MREDCADAPIINLIPSRSERGFFYKTHTHSFSEEETMERFTEEDVVKLLELLREPPKWDPSNVGANTLATNIRKTFYGYEVCRGHSTEHVVPSVRGIIPLFEFYLRCFPK